MSFKREKIVCIGEVLWDCLPDGEKPGGAPMNVALHLKQFGLDVNIISRIGNDQKGFKLLSFIKESGLDTDYIQIDDDHKTSEVIVDLEDENNAKYEIVEQVAWDYLELNRKNEALVSDSGIIVYGTLASRNIKSRNTISQLLTNDCVKLIDVNLRPPFTDQKIVDELIMQSDIAKLNDDELEIISGWNGIEGDEIRKLRKFAAHYGCDIVILTKGDRGATLYKNGNIYEHQGYKINVADSVGAGDAFLAGFLKGILENIPIEKNLDFACATGAYVASMDGATPNYNMDEIYQIMNP